MKTKIRFTALALVLLALVMAGFVSAQERVAPEAPGGGAGIDATSGVMCLDARCVQRRHPGVQHHPRA